jgi:hypothetical protein
MWGHVLGGLFGALLVLTGAFIWIKTGGVDRVVDRAFEDAKKREEFK